MPFLSLLCRTLQVSRVSWLLLYFISSTNTSFDTLNFSSASRTTSPSRSSNPAAANGSSRPPSVTPYSLSIRPTSIPSNWRNPRNNSSSTPAPLSLSPAAPAATARSRSHVRRPPHRVHSPSAAFPKTSALRPQTPDTARASNTSNCASMQTQASPNSKSHNAGNPRRPVPPAPFRKIPPSHLRSAPLPRYIAHFRSATLADRKSVV